MAGSWAGKALLTRRRVLCGEWESVEEIRWVSVSGW